jgi:hypothetical protein
MCTSVGAYLVATVGAIIERYSVAPEQFAELAATSPSAQESSSPTVTSAYRTFAVVEVNPIHRVDELPHPFTGSSACSPPHRG